MKSPFVVTRSACALSLLGLLPSITVQAQDDTRQSLAGEEAAEASARAALPERFNLRWGAGGLTLAAGLRGEYVDNVFLTDNGRREDYILVPEVDVRALFPLGQLNTIDLNVGVAYYHYFKNDDLNSQGPLVNPNSQVAFNLLTGDFAFKVTESFSYQESPFYELGAPFYNVYNTGRFGRFYNVAGAAMTWDLQNVVVTGGYHHANFWAKESSYDYINRASELFDAKALVSATPDLSVGPEIGASLNDYDNVPWSNNWRVRVGPAAVWKPSRFLTARAGAGYEHIQFEDQWEDVLGLTSLDTYYFSVEIEHELNRFIRHRLECSHENEQGINAANLAGTHVRYGLDWQARTFLSVSPYIGIHFYEESYGSSSSAPYSERFTYFDTGLAAAYQLDLHWRARLSWNYRFKDSELQNLDYGQNVVRAEIRYQF